MDYSELKHIFQDLKHTFPLKDLTAHIIFTEDSFDQQYPLLSRTYRISSNNKAFWPSMSGYSIFGDCLDGTDQGVRLDYYMAEERDPNGWKVEDCYILEQMRDAKAIPNHGRTAQIDGTVCCYFGDTCIRVRESYEKDKIHLEPVAGDQVACGEWAELPIDRVYGYCTLLERHLNQEAVLRFTAVRESGKSNEAKAFQTCYGDLYVIVNALHDYANSLDRAIQEQGLTGFQAAAYELHAARCRKIAGKYAAAIGYDYDKAMEQCRKRRTKGTQDNDTGQDGLEALVKRQRK